jgi:hypothetical protein
MNLYDDSPPATNYRLGVCVALPVFALGLAGLLAVGYYAGGPGSSSSRPAPATRAEAEPAPPPPAGPHTPRNTVLATDLCRAYYGNAAAATSHFGNQAVTVLGVVERCTFPGGRAEVLLRDGDGRMDGVVCVFPGGAAQVADLSTGEEVFIRGWCRGLSRGSRRVVLTSCAVSGGPAPGGR